MKALASDLDGTLFFRNIGFKQEDLEAIKEFQSHGNLFGISSGRPLYCIYPTTKGFIDCDFYIASSGAVIVDKDENVIYESLISYDILERLYNEYKGKTPFLVQADHEYFAMDQAFESMDKIIYSIEEFKTKKVYGVSFVFDGDLEKTRRVNEDMMAKFPELVGHQNLDSIDITTAECSKGKAVRQLKERLSIERVGAIGDSYNDLSMIIDSDAGFTFPHCPDEIKNNANYIVASVAESLKILEEE